MEKDQEWIWMGEQKILTQARDQYPWNTFSMCGGFEKQVKSRVRRADMSSRDRADGKSEN